jgi:DNA modification methylase
MTKPKITETNISSLTPDPNNARKRTPLSAKVISKSLEQFGACRSIVIDENDVIRAGNGTFEEAGQLGIEKVLVVEADGNTIVAVKRKGLSESDWKQYAIADNTASDFSTWDFDLLNDLAQEVDLSEFFPDYKLNELLESFGKGEGFDSNEQQEEENEEEIAELLDKVDEIESRVKLGEIWALGRHRLGCGDSTIDGNVRALLGDRFGDVGMVWSDPPFNTKQQQGRTSSEWGIIENDNLSDSDFKKFVEKFADIVLKLNPESIYVCCNWRSYPLFFSLFPDINNLIVWVKNNFGLGSGYRPQHELIIFQGKIESNSESNVWNVSKDSANSYNHPMQKPVELIEKAFANSTQPDDLIFDPFLGSGTSIIAAQKMEGDRTVYGFELSEAYCEIILQRFEKFTGIEPKLIGRLPD